MKKSFLFLFSGLLATFTLGAQAPANFSCNDCGGNYHDLYTELASGKVIVISFVMPCVSCIAPSMDAYNVVQSYATSNPGQVLMYFVDDNANTSCSVLNNWVTSNNMHSSTSFSDPALVEGNYGPGGMPKIIVVGGGNNPTFFHNDYGPASGDSATIRSAIDAALATAVHEQQSPFSALGFFPNPSNAVSTLSVEMEKSNAATVTLYDQPGREVMTVFSGMLFPGENKIPVNTAELSNGIYFVRISDAEGSRMMKIVVAH